jgi:hypothetical protein
MQAELTMLELIGKSSRPIAMDNRLTGQANMVPTLASLMLSEPP